MEAFGFSEADYAESEVDVWPDCWLSVQLFGLLGTQWRVGFSGAYGLDYAAVAAVMDMQGVEEKARPALLDDIRIMEAEALAMMREKAK